MSTNSPKQQRQYTYLKDSPTYTRFSTQFGNSLFPSFSLFSYATKPNISVKSLITNLENHKFISKSFVHLFLDQYNFLFMVEK
ncbi:CLUMA_CG003874, isoform A [Clunio marinus]|uniref:CLUMA_CG003874, isoform A n=1 Tax=Clunio marinus TaxID=568069 RepID=A0A1J1HQ35_9DIPT|nr:CLUMA_CG003874, isoform A [Clunio marinus]